ncbi:MAG TPA: Uma2 family endonuclease [Acidobacteriaceae bacterium]|nr:Uma2 family endonuclease [Acidobacteriaceae bacterium]
MATAPVFDYRGEYDENWPLPKTLTLEQYRHVIFRPDAHYVDGKILPRTLGDWTHSKTVGEIIGALHPTGTENGLSACISLRLQTSPTRIRVCDFVVLDRNAPYEPVPTVPPLLCIEVITEGQLPEDEVEILSDYFAMGVKNIWLVDPVRRAAFTFDADGLHEADPTGLMIPNSPIQLDLTETFAAIE